MLDKNLADSDIAALQNGTVKMTDLIRDWLSFVQYRYAHTTYAAYKSAMTKFLTLIPKDIPPKHMKPQHIEYLMTNTLRSNLSPRTANLYLAAIKSFYRWAETHCDDVPNAAVHVQSLKLSPANVRILSPNEYSRAVQNSTGLDRDAIQFLGNTGLRRNEFRSLVWRDFQGGFLRINGKGDKTRLVPLNDICKQIVEKQKHIGLVPAFVAAYVKKQTIYKLCTRVSKNANIDYFTPHSLRHFFATRLIKKGVPLIVVSKILGHANTQITEKIYVHLAPDDLRVTNCLSI